MTELFPFITVLAWIFGIGATLLVALRLLGAWSYDDIERLHDMARGFEKTFPIGVPLMVAIVCWAWVIVM